MKFSILALFIIIINGVNITTKVTFPIVHIPIMKTDYLITVTEKPENMSDDIFWAYKAGYIGE